MVFCPSSLFYFECYIFIYCDKIMHDFTLNISDQLFYILFTDLPTIEIHIVSIGNSLELISHHNKSLNKYILISCDFSSTKTNWTVKNDPILNPSGS
jgi:hypothetical protein